MKLTPIWMFLLLLAILIISVLIGSRVNEEGFTTQTSYSETDLTGYANKVYPIVAGSIFFDKSNGNLVLQEDSKVSTIISRGGRETKVSSDVKLDSKLPKSIESASASWSISIGTTGQLYYIPFGKTTYIQLFNGEKISGFCFRDSDVFTGDYETPFNVMMSNPDKNMLYTTLMPVTDNQLTSNKLFKSQLFGIKEAGLFYDVGTGSLVIPKTADSVDIITRDGTRLDDAAINKLKITADGPTKNMIDFSLDTKYTLNQNAEFKPWYMFIGSGDAIKTVLANEVTAKKTVDDAAKSLVEVKAKTGVTAAEIATAQKALDDANSKLSMATTAKFQTAKPVFVMPYKDNTVIATFDNTYKLIGVMRFNKDGYVMPIAVIEENTLSEKPSAESAISEYYKWYWYWRKTGAGTMTDDYMLKTQIVPPVCPSCPSCPSATCASAPVSVANSAPVSVAKSEPVSGSNGAKPISDAVKTTGSVAEKAIGTTGDILKSFGSGAKDVGLGTVDLTKSAVTGTVGIAKDVVGGTVGLARDTAGGTVNLVKDAAKGTVGLVKDTAGSAIDLTKDTIKGTVRMANGKNRADSNSWAGRNQPRNWTDASYDNDGGDYTSETMDPYTYNGALKKKATSNFIPVTADFSAFSR